MLGAIERNKRNNHIPTTTSKSCYTVQQARVAIQWVDFDLIHFLLIFSWPAIYWIFISMVNFGFLMGFDFGFYFYFCGWFWFWFLFLWLIFTIYWALLGFFFCGFCLRFWYMCWIIWICFQYDTFLVVGLMALFLCLAVWWVRERETWDLRGERIIFSNLIFIRIATLKPNPYGFTVAILLNLQI